MAERHEANQKEKVKEKSSVLTISDWIETLMSLQETAGNIPLEFIIPAMGVYDERAECRTDLICEHIHNIHIDMNRKTATPESVAITIGNKP